MFIHRADRFDSAMEDSSALFGSAGEYPSRWRGTGADRPRTQVFGGSILLFDRVEASNSPRWRRATQDRRLVCSRAQQAKRAFKEGPDEYFHQTPCESSPESQVNALPSSPPVGACLVGGGAKLWEHR